MSDSKHTIYGSRIEREIEHLRQQRDELLAIAKRYAAEWKTV